MRMGRIFILGAGLTMSVVLAGPAAAGDCENAGHAGVVDCPPDPTVSGTVADPGGSGVQGDATATGTQAVPQAQVLGRTLSRGAGGVGGLPVTGADILQLVVIGGSAAGVGAILVTGSRRRRSTA